ncbi:hypothetical protein PAMC26577_36935 [Caballeronia sordidicola]|uniref:Uncharacterized protein n=1 Tax=Caballeronia sordidicola TaxID=196367 RepID=A0A242M8M3_CABSO|nr:hypothetical protein PAMC26577_36935 [Caballeronia sordidicola]
MMPWDLKPDGAGIVMHTGAAAAWRVRAAVFSASKLFLLAATTYAC